MNLLKISFLINQTRLIPSLEMFPLSDSTQFGVIIFKGKLKKIRHAGSTHWGSSRRIIIFSKTQTGSPLRHLHLLSIRQAGFTHRGFRHRIIMCSKSDWQVPLIGQYFSFMGDKERYHWPFEFMIKGRLICDRLLVTCSAKGDDHSDNDDKPGRHTYLRSSVPFIVHARR